MLFIDTDMNFEIVIFNFDYLLIISIYNLFEDHKTEFSKEV